MYANPRKRESEKFCDKSNRGFKTSRIKFDESLRENWNETANLM